MAMTPRAARGLLLAVAAATAVAAGCGKKGPPLPPLRSYPKQVDHLSSRQIGDRLVLSFPEPSSRTDGTPLGPDARIEILMTTRDPAPKRAGEIELNPDITWAVPRPDWRAYAQGRRLDIGLGLARITASLGRPAGPAALKGRRLSFIVQVVEPGNKRSMPSGIETIEVCAPPPAPANSAARVVEEGLQLSWIAGQAPGQAPGQVPGQPGGPPTSQPGPPAAAPQDPNAAAGPAAAAPRYNIYREEEGGERPETPLHASPVGADGYLDDAAVPGRSYRYTVRAVAAAPRCESADSAVVVATRVDLFPPAPPQGLAAVAEGGAIRLFWRPNREADLAGYRVWRAAGEEAAWTLLTPQDQTATSYTDGDVKPGVVYSYAVTARDGATPPNESAFSEPAIEKTETGR